MVTDCHAPAINSFGKSGELTIQELRSRLQTTESALRLALRDHETMTRTIEDLRIELEVQSRAARAFRDDTQNWRETYFETIYGRPPEDDGPAFR